MTKLSLNYNYKVLILPVFLAVFILGTAVFSFVNAEPAEGVTQDQIDAALDDLSGIYGERVVSQEQAREICDLDKYTTDCAEIGKKHDLFPAERIQQVDSLLDEIKGQVAEQIKTCESIECLVGVAQGLASRIARKDPDLASEVDLTPKIVQEKKQIVEAAKKIGLTIDQCINMDPDTASIEILRGCAKLAKEDRVKKYIPAETRGQVDQIADSTERTVQLKEALSGGKYQCGNNTIEGCGNFCLNPGTEARAEGTSAIPAVCKEIAAKFFGPQGIRELENSYSQVSGIADHYYRKAQNSVFTTLDGRILTSPDQIGQYMEEQGKAGNVEAISKGMDFMVSQGFATQADKDFAVKMVSKFREKGGVSNFDVCVQNPKACRDFISDDFQNSFNVMDQVFEIMRQELGFSPDLCDQGQFDQSIGTKCLEGARRALPKIEALASQYPEVRSIVEEIKSHISRGDQLTQRRDQFTGGNFAGPGGCRDERECFVYCSNPANGPECIAFGAKQGISGFTGDQAVTKYQQYEDSLNRTNFISQPGQEQGQIVTGDVIYRQGVSPECVRAIKSGDFVRAKELCDVNIGGPQPVPGEPFRPPTICPASPYVQCPEGQYHESFRNSDGCFVDGPCKPIPTYSPGPYPTGGPYPTYSPGPGGSSCSKSLISLLGDGCHQMYTDLSGRQIYCDGPMSKSAKEGDSVTVPGCSSGLGGPGPYPTYSPYPSYTPYPGGWEGQYPGQCSDGIDNDGDALIDFADSSCNVSPIGVGNCPAGYHYHGEQGGFCMNDQENYGSICYSADGKTKISCPFQSTGQCTPPQYWDPARGYCVGSTSPSPWPSPGTNSCPAGYHYHGESGGFCMNDREDYSGTCYTSDGKSTTTCPKSTYPSPQICPSGQWWDYARNACVSSTATYTPYPSCPSGQWWDTAMSKCTSTVSSCGPGYYWDSATNICKPNTGTTYTPAPSCPSGQWWDYARNACVSSTATYTPYPSCPGGQWWDSAKNACTCSNGYSFDAVSNICKSNCASDQWWDSATSSCKSIYVSPIYTPYPSYTPYSGYCGDAVCGSSETAISCPLDCGGGTTSYTPYPTTAYTPPPTPSCPSGQWWDYASNSCIGSTTTYTPPPYSPPPSTYSPPPPPPPTSALYNHFANLHCAEHGRIWDGQYCQPTGFLARVFENTLANLGKLIGF